MMDKYKLIMEAEHQFAREVTLGVIVTRPLTAWHYIIPGFFIIDFLRRGSAIRQYTNHFMFPRNLALDAAMSEIQADKEKMEKSDLVDPIRLWLEPLKLYTPQLVEAHVALIERLGKHYFKLLNADGDTFNLLIENAYNSGESFKKFIEEITTIENEVDRQVIELLGGNERVREKILAEQDQIARRRRKLLDGIF